MLDRGGNIQIHRSGSTNTAAASGGGAVAAGAALSASASFPWDALYVYGTAGNDSMEIRPGAAGAISVWVNGQTLGTYNGIERVYLFGGDGNDTLRVLATVGNIQAVMYGGDGNDNLVGGVGANFLVGGDGDDTLTGNAGRDILIGGPARQAPGRTESDVLVGGDYLFSDNLMAVDALMAAWASAHVRPARARRGNRRGPRPVRHERRHRPGRF